MHILLDAGPLGMASNPNTRGPAAEAREWMKRHIDAGDRFFVPEIADYEVRRELMRANKAHGISRLDAMAELGYLRLTTETMRDAAMLWAEARNRGQPTASNTALDGDVILAAQARAHAAANPDRDIVIATTNVAHLSRYADARLWREM
ncbi:hypothetical protein BH23ACT9_BH23ACT9_30100 [soil metagenome]